MTFALLPSDDYWYASRYRNRDGRFLAPYELSDTNLRSVRTVGLAGELLRKVNSGSGLSLMSLCRSIASNFGFMKASRSEHRSSLFDGRLPGVARRKKIVRQQWNFSPAGSTTEVEDYTTDLKAVSVLELAIQPDIGGREAVASLAACRLGARCWMCERSSSSMSLSI